MGRSLRTAVGAVLVVSVALPAGSAAQERFDEVVQFGTGPGAERVSDIAVAEDGSTFVVGSTFGAFPGFQNEWELDGFVAKVGPDGEVVWADQFGGDDNGENGAMSVAFDGAGGVYVVGVTQQDLHDAVEGYSDPFLRKYSEDGELLWGHQWHGTSAENWVEWASGVAVGDGTVYVTGSVDGRGFLRAYATSGTMLSWAPQTDVELHDVATEGADVYLVGVRFDPRDQWAGERRGFVRRISPSGTVEVPFGGAGEPMRLALSDQAVAAAGLTWAHPGESVATQWDRALAEERWTWIGDPFINESLAVTEAGDVFLGGIADWESGDAVVRKLRAADGSLAWQARLPSVGWGIGGLVSGGDRITFAGSSASELTPGGVGAFLARWPVVRTVPVTRLAGADRIGTAVTISRDAFPTGSDGVVLASALRFADAVVAAPLAAGAGGPVLLVGDAVTPALRDELRRLVGPAGAVTVVGGTGAVAAAVEDQLRALGFDITRIAGPTRYDTAVEVALALGSPPAMVTDGRAFADALVAGTAAIQTGHAVVLTDGPRLPSVTQQYLREAGSGHVAVGGPAAEAAPGAEAVVGADRYETATKVLERFFGTHHSVGIASGTDFADALSVAPLLGKDEAPLLLTPPGELAPVIVPFVGLDLLEVYVAGGTDAIGQGVEQALQGLLTEAR